MVKFCRQLEAQLIPEWKEAFVNYRQLKKIIKKIKLSRPSNPNPEPQNAISIRDPVRVLTANASGLQRRVHVQVDAGQQESEEELVRYCREDEVKLFFEKLDEELSKVNAFHELKEAEFVERGEILGKQLQILLDFKLILERRRLNRTLSRRIVFPESGGESSGKTSPAAEMLAALERNGVTYTGTPRTKAKKGGKPRAAAVRIDIPATTPRSTIQAMTIAIWQDVVNSSSSNEGGDYITKKKIQRAEKMIRKGYVELYKGLGLLHTFSDLNFTAFGKIMKKFDKVTSRHESSAYLGKVKGTQFVSSDKAVRLCDQVESIFTKHFAENDRKKAMKYLRLEQPKGSNLITFFVGLLTGAFATLLVVYVILAYSLGVFFFTKNANGGYIEAVYPIFSVFALLSLHLCLYGCNLYAWRRTRINHNFIFELSPSTSLRTWDTFLVSATLMIVVLGAMVIHLLLVTAGIPLHPFDDIPVILLLLFVVVLFCPLNICYRSTRYCFLGTIGKIILAPLYKVGIVDFYLADQLCSQILLLRQLEFIVCFFMVGGFRIGSHDTCTQSWLYKQLSYIIALLPYYWRVMQCLRRYLEEGYELEHLANLGKNASVLVAAGARMKYKVALSLPWMVAVILTSSFATTFQIYWDIIKDWGLFCKNSRNRWLRDELVLKNKMIYYISIVANAVLRLAWIQTITHFDIGRIETRLVDFVMASLEIVRRGLWNYFRLENEHLNNVGKLRALKAVPLPFRELGMD